MAIFGRDHELRKLSRLIEAPQMCLWQHMVVVLAQFISNSKFLSVFFFSEWFWFQFTRGDRLLFYPRVKRIIYLMYTVWDQILRISSLPRCGHVHEGQLVKTSQTTFWRIKSGFNNILAWPASIAVYLWR